MSFGIIFEQKKEVAEQTALDCMADYYKRNGRGLPGINSASAYHPDTCRSCGTVVWIGGKLNAYVTECQSCRSKQKVGFK